MSKTVKDIKSQKIFLIKEVSEITGVPPHTIRLWEKDFKKYLRSAKTQEGQRRYYSRHIELIKKIKYLQYQDKYTIAGTLRCLERDAADPVDLRKDFLES